MTLHNIARVYPGVSPFTVSQEPASFWLRHLTILEEAGVLKEKQDG